MNRDHADECERTHPDGLEPQRRQHSCDDQGGGVCEPKGEPEVAACLPCEREQPPRENEQEQRERQERRQGDPAQPVLADGSPAGEAGGGYGAKMRAKEWRPSDDDHRIWRVENGASALVQLSAQSVRVKRLDVEREKVVPPRYYVRAGKVAHDPQVARREPEVMRAAAEERLSHRRRCPFA